MRYPVSKLLRKNLNFLFLGWISILSDRIILDNCYHFQWYIMIQDMFSDKRDINGYMYQWLITPQYP